MKNIFDTIEGLKPVDPELLAEYERAMTEEAIPEIIEVLRMRRITAEESRRRVL